jgi:hypothetical protein
MARGILEEDAATNIDSPTEGVDRGGGEPSPHRWVQITGDRDPDLRAACRPSDPSPA